MTDVLLKNGPCDPRRVEMVVTPDATEVFVSPQPFDCYDVYTVTEKFLDAGDVKHATGVYAHTTGSRTQINAYRKALARIGLGRAFTIKRVKVHG